ncbi:hypothetical protein WDW86_07925 [Bdellovibrionota bacterium FG-2]
MKKMKVWNYIFMVCVLGLSGQSWAEELLPQERSLTFFGQVIEITSQVVVVKNGLGTRKLRRTPGDSTLSPDIQLGDHVMIIGGVGLDTQDEVLPSAAGIWKTGSAFFEAPRQQAGQAPSEQVVTPSVAPLVVPIVVDDRAFFPG